MHHYKVDKRISLLYNSTKDYFNLILITKSYYQFVIQITKDVPHTMEFAFLKRIGIYSNHLLIFFNAA